jgi:hypothetical protein
MPGNVNAPEESACVVRDRPVAGLANVTLAPGRAIFCASMTFPCRVAVPLCATASCAVVRHMIAAASHVIQCCLLIVSPQVQRRARS